jgi:23S rRNA (uracil1939-C5)-methyltransferase
MREFEPPPVLEIESLDHEGKGVAHRDGKVVFVEGALPGELARVRLTRTRNSFDVAIADEILRESSQRVKPSCPHYGVCGGCSMQHFHPAAQVAAKQRVLEDCLERIGGVRADELYPVIQGPDWHYRDRARLSVRHVHKKGSVLVGFHERKSSYVAEMGECRILPQRISALILPLRELIDGLSIRDRLPQIELAAGEGVDLLVFRILQPLTTADEARVRAFADRHGVYIALQPKGPDTIRLFHPETWPGLAYELPEFGLRFEFSATEFTQVNAGVNRMLVRRAMSLLAPRSGERIADLFCGLGNFSLPIARLGASVVGVEGSDALVRRARRNAELNGLQDLAEFRVADLFEVTPESLAALGPFDAMLIDPPRDGAIALVKAMQPPYPRRLVYVSCSPSTLARDAGMLVNVHGYRLEGAGVANMFPHTAHVESIAYFSREP